MLSTEEKNLTVLANAVELAGNIVRDVAGNDISNRVDGEDVKTILANTITAKINAKLAPYLGE